MIECSNADIRDQLPELVNGRLNRESLGGVQAHLVDCAPCQADLLLLERARAMLILATPRIDTARIARALSAPGTHSHRQTFNWRIAATIAVLAVGGGSAAVVYGGWSTPHTIDPVALAPSRTEEPIGGAAIGGASDGSELSVSGDLSSLTDEQLRALLGRVEAIETLPAAEARVPAQLSGVVPMERSRAHDPSGAL